MANMTETEQRTHRLRRIERALGHADNRTLDLTLVFLEGTTAEHRHTKEGQD